MRTHAVLAWVRTRAAGAFLLSLLVGGALLGGPAPARAQGRVTFTQLSIERCKGTCTLKLSCATAGKPESELMAGKQGRTKDLVDIGKSTEVQQFPLEVKCTAYKDTGWIGTTWTKIGSGSVNAAVGGDYRIDIANAEQGDVRVLLVIDSLEVLLPTAPSAAAPAAPAASAKGKKAAAAAGTLQLAATFNPAKEGHAVVIGMEWPAFKSKVDTLAAQGIKLVAIKNFDAGGGRLWAGIFKNVSDRVVLRANQSWEEFSSQWKQMTGGRARLIDMEVYGDSAKPQFAGLYRDYSEAHSLWVGQERKDFLQKVKDLRDLKEQQLVDVDTYRTNGKLFYAGAFRQTTGKYDLWPGLDRAAFDAKWKEGNIKGLQLVEVVTYKDGGKRVYDGIVRSGMGGPGDVLLDADLATFVKRWLDDTGKGLRLTSIDLYHD